MHKRIIFIMTHEHSDYELLTDSLNAHKYINCYDTHHGYHHPDDLQYLLSLPHKNKTSAAIWCDIIKYNKDFTCKSIVNYCKFIYWIKNPNEYRRYGLYYWYQRTKGIINPNLSEINSILSTIF